MSDEKSEGKKEDSDRSYSEKDLTEWATQLQQLQQPLAVAPGTRLLAETRPALNAQAERQWQWIDTFPVFLILGLIIACIAKKLVDPYFGRVQGPIRLMEGGHVAEHNGMSGESGSFRVLRYSSIPVDSAQITMERISSSSQVFIGVVSQSEEFAIHSAYGWLISSGRIQENGNSLVKFLTRVKE